MPMFRYSFSSVSAVCFAAVAVAAEPATFPADDLRHSAIRLERVTGTPVLPRLPVLLEITVSNSTSRPIVVPLPTLSEAYNDFNTLDVYYARPSAADAGAKQETDKWRRVEFLVPNGLVCKENLSSPPPEQLTLQPGESWTKRVPVSYDWNQTLPRPIVDVGELRLQARLCGVAPGADGRPAVQRDSYIASNLLAVAVPKPQGMEADVYQMIMKRPRPWLVAGPNLLSHYLDEEGYFRFAEKLVSRYPDSTYSLYARAGLAHMYAVGDVDPDRGKMDRRNPSWPIARRLIADATADPRFVLDDDMANLTATLDMWKRGKEQTARERHAQRVASEKDAGQP